MSIIKTAIFVDAAFFIKRAIPVFGKLEAKDLADKLWQFCLYHAYPNIEDKGDWRKLSKAQRDKKFCEALDNLYRIFVYDCPPLEKSLYHPFLKKDVNFRLSERSVWRKNFHTELKTKRKVALRLGHIDDVNLSWGIAYDKIKALCNGAIALADLTEEDFFLNARQKGVDMRIGTDIASVAFKKQAARIVLVSGDSDFVPAAKLARREGMDFILDPMHSPIKADLQEHIDGKRTVFPKPVKRPKAK